MKLNFPVRIAGANDAPGVGIQLPVGLAANPSALAGSARAVHSMRAVAAATALYDARECLEIVKAARESPESVIAPDVDSGKLGVLLNAVSRVLDREGEPPKTSKAERAAAAAVNARPELVAAALGAINGGRNKAERDALAKEARDWVAAVNPALLEKAARAGATATQLDLVPTQTTRFERLEANVSDLQQRITKLEKA